MSSRRPTFLISLAAFVLTSVLLYQGYGYRCAVLTCEPLTWPEMQAIARTYAAEAGTGYHIQAVFAEPAYGTTNTMSEPEAFQVSMKFVAPEPAETMPTQAMYRAQTIAFETREQVVRWRGGNEKTSDRPSLESQQRFDRVRIGPSDAYRLTWQQAQQDLSGSFDHTLMVLAFRDQEPDLSGPESSWFIMYYGKSNIVSYRVDAQTGTIVYRHKQ